jgi:hypothetical protein
MFSSSSRWIGDMRKIPLCENKACAIKGFHLLQLDKVELRTHFLSIGIFGNPSGTLGCLRRPGLL